MQEIKIKTAIILVVLIFFIMCFTYIGNEFLIRTPPKSFSRYLLKRNHHILTL